MNIEQNQFYIKNLRNVVRSELKNKPKPWAIKNRHSDAFVYVTSGNCEYTFNGKSIVVQEGDIVYLAKGSSYTMKLSGKIYKFIFCDFDFNVSENKCNVFTPKNTFETKNLFSKLHKSYQVKSITECMSILYKIYCGIQASVSNNYIEKSAKQKIISTKEYVDINYKDISLSVGKLAEKVNFSEVYFRKLFKSVYGITPSEYIISVRLKSAEELMKYSFLSLSECALNSGFSSLQYFCRVFKKHTGISPAKYRKKQGM